MISLVKTESVNNLQINHW